MTPANSADSADGANAISVCEGCGKGLCEGDMAHHCADGIDLCFECAPTFQQMLDELPVQADADAELAAKVQRWIDRHVASGGALTDKAVTRIPVITKRDLARVDAAMEAAEEKSAPTETQH